MLYLLTNYYLLIYNFFKYHKIQEKSNGDYYIHPNKLRKSSSQLDKIRKRKILDIELMAFAAKK